MCAALRCRTFYIPVKADNGTKDRIEATLACPACNLQWWKDDDPSFNYVRDLFVALDRWQRRDEILRAEKEKKKLIGLGFTLTALSTDR